MSTNRRKHPRIPIDTEIKVSIGFKTFYPLRCDNISMGGMRVYLTNPVKQGKKGKLWVAHLVNRDIVSFVAPFKVLWVSDRGVGPCMGVEFFNMKRKDEYSLLRLLRYQGSTSVST